MGGSNTIYSSTGRPSSSTGFTVSDPYYREYFTTVASGAGTPEPVYSSQLRQSQLGYGEETAGASATTSFVERYVRQSAYHGKGVIAAATAAGLTVDLPSPDSGIGADAITPRDQNTLQQVSPRPKPHTQSTSSKTLWMNDKLNAEPQIFEPWLYSTGEFQEKLVRQIVQIMYNFVQTIVILYTLLRSFGPSILFVLEETLNFV